MIFGKRVDPAKIAQAEEVLGKLGLGLEGWVMFDPDGKPRGTTVCETIGQPFDLVPKRHKELRLQLTVSWMQVSVDAPSPQPYAKKKYKEPFRPDTFFSKLRGEATLIIFEDDAQVLEPTVVEFVLTLVDTNFMDYGPGSSAGFNYEEIFEASLRCKQ